ncbi:MAG: amino acid adenylation domain-containing protein, partial [Chloroflexi bacterium]
MVNATQAPTSEKLLHTLFCEQVVQRPDQIAVISPRCALTYKQVHSGALQLAHQLRVPGGCSNQLIGVVMEKGWEQIVAVLGILHSGAAYLPLDASLPGDRLRYLLANGQVQVVVTQSWVDERIVWPKDVQRICIDDLALDDVLTPCGCPVETGDGVVQRPDDLAYVIYTSGSTGLPKGVMISHRAAVNTILDINRRFAVGSTDRVLALSALHFDLSVYDIFGLLAAGGTIVLPPAGSQRDPALWLELLARERVTLWNSVPALLEMLLALTSASPLTLQQSSLRLALISGDWIPLSLPARVKESVPTLQLISLGGATEASIWSIMYPIEHVEPSCESIAYGKPLCNQHFHVLNERLEPCPVWVAGQLYIGGIGLARGYWRDEAKTQASFLIHPHTGQRLYRTGDMGRYWPDGNIEFLGREDFQVKIAGHRIELGEIEAALLEHPAVSNAVVTATGKPFEHKHLIAYVVATRNGTHPI